MKLYPKITLVGAGPGDADLISLKGLKALAMANVVLYDALINDELLTYAPAHALRVYVGKRANRHAYSQQEINEMMVAYARSQGHVVRLKGGDPFVFGRGGEELEYAAKHFIPTAVVPGISSSIALAGLQGIPLTYRGVSESFWVITGSTTTGVIAKDIYTAAKTDATVVVLMGLNKLTEITEIYRQEGRGNLPVAIIQNGSLPDEKIALGTMDTIEAEAGDQQIGAPAVIIIGEVVGKHERFTSRQRRAVAI
ncbi:uroporphyrinogen-III C-methyltransferase [Parapedobacter sp. ISTM3]|uniref:uroporphyrinogen-III C-methyltransferase n=1 Tax=Parapedobacter luteus TaxID=623280 RepID=A0A1T5AYT0_9SPHI|nr:MULTISPECIES: uroporphyrinogen-III C-methyltransferase [Parapedobacter]MBK1440385.1 uroporphyrinogen-III C-methyltransferase [Parapedobacter sp. ISTM3]SKB40168.1 uroporphyrin-III C-methyltransferase [Parapedobacter luteus]